MRDDTKRGCREDHRQDTTAPTASGRDMCKTALLVYNMCTRLYVHSVLIYNSGADLARPLRLPSCKTLRLARLKHRDQQLRSSEPKQVACC